MCVALLFSLGPDVGLLYKRLFNHRPIIQNEVHYFVREFEVRLLVPSWVCSHPVAMNLEHRPNEERIAISRHCKMPCQRQTRSILSSSMK